MGVQLTVEARVIVWLSAADVLPVKFVSPVYWAVIECAPTESALVVSVAWRAALSVAVPSEVVPSRKVTVPVGVPLPGATTFTVAVKVTACPTVAGFTDDATVVVVPCFVTIRLNVVVRLSGVPVTVMRKVPVGVVALVAIVNVLEQEGVHEAGANVGVAPAGSPEAANATAWAVPALNVAVIVVDPAAPGITVMFPELVRV